MRIVLQKVSHAGVTVTDEATGELDPTFTEQTIAAGYVLLVGVSDADGTSRSTGSPTRSRICACSKTNKAR